MRSAARVVSGSVDSPVVLHVPHGSRHIPDAVRAGIVLTDDELAVELDRMTDTGTDLIARRAARAASTAPWIVRNSVSRLVVDPERFPDERERMRAVGMGAVYTNTSHGQVLRHHDREAEKALLDEHFDPYAHAVARLVGDRLAATGRAVILDVHSYPSTPLPYERHADGARPPVCLGTDPLHSPAWLIDAAHAAFAPCGEVAENTPFAGCYVPLRYYGSNPDVAAVMIEIRRDTYLTEPAGQPTPAMRDLTAALARLIDNCRE